MSRGFQSGSNSWLVYQYVLSYSSLWLIWLNFPAIRPECVIDLQSTGSSTLGEMRLTFRNHTIAVARHEAALLSVQPGHLADLCSVPVKLLSKRLVSFAAVVEMC